MVDVVLRDVWVLYRISKDKGDKSVPLLAFRKNVVNTMFLKYSKEGRLSSKFEISHQMFVMMTQHIIRFNLKNKAGVRCAKKKKKRKTLNDAT